MRATIWSGSTRSPSRTRTSATRPEACEPTLVSISPRRRPDTAIDVTTVFSTGETTGTAIGRDRIQPNPPATATIGIAHHTLFEIADAMSASAA